eukprot:scaffold739_cov38-Prasinocladus_malaysianus.AAC.1
MAGCILQLAAQRQAAGRSSAAGRSARSGRPDGQPPQCPPGRIGPAARQHSHPPRIDAATARVNINDKHPD